MTNCPGGRMRDIKPRKIKTSPTKPVTFTKKAATFIADMKKKEGKDKFALRIEVISGGCAGLSYYMGFQEKPEKDEKLYKVGNLNVIISNESLKLVAGSQIDYVSDLQQSGLKVENPNATKGCACGKSFC